MTNEFPSPAPAQPNGTAAEPQACPFCGRNDRLKRETTGGANGFGWPLTKCYSCGASGPHEAGNGMCWSSRAPSLAVDAGLSPTQEPKYTVNGHAIVNRASGEAIPADEPVFIFRARDMHAMYALRDYLHRLPAGSEHHKAVEARCMDFFNFKAAHLDRMKEPDTDFYVPVQPTGGA